VRQAKCVEVLRNETEDYPQFADFDDSLSSAGNDVSVGPALSTGTPAAATPTQPKLKLTFNNSNRDSAGISNGGPDSEDT
jgi:ATP-dependent helicase STH1/SNF2